MQGQRAKWGTRRKWVKKMSERGAQVFRGSMASPCSKEELQPGLEGMVGKLWRSGCSACFVHEGRGLYECDGRNGLVVHVASNEVRLPAGQKVHKCSCCVCSVAMTAKGSAGSTEGCVYAAPHLQRPHISRFPPLSLYAPRVHICMPCLPFSHSLRPSFLCAKLIGLLTQASTRPRTPHEASCAHKRPSVRPLDGNGEQALQASTAFSLCCSPSRRSAMPHAEPPALCSFA